jgi:hypothetical protein
MTEPLTPSGAPSAGASGCPVWSCGCRSPGLSPAKRNSPTFGVRRLCRGSLLRFEPLLRQPTRRRPLGRQPPYRHRYSEGRKCGLQVPCQSFAPQPRPRLRPAPERARRRFASSNSFRHVAPLPQPTANRTDRASSASFSSARHQSESPDPVCRKDSTVSLYWQSKQRTIALASSMTAHRRKWGFSAHTGECTR